MRLDWLELRVPPLLLTGGAAILTAISARAAGRSVLPPSPSLATLVGAVAVLCGLAIALWGVVAFRRAQTTVDPRHPERSGRLVTTGIYRWSRNPMYLGFVLVLVGMAVALQTPAGLVLAVLTAGYLDRFQIRPEERRLRQRFPSEFATYCAVVRRWI